MLQLAIFFFLFLDLPRTMEWWDSWIDYITQITCSVPLALARDMFFS